jgi:ABC-type bacteriocin/lantibiotic exporter with double-glycine peptidase domain
MHRATWESLRHSLALFARLVRLVRSFWGAMGREMTLGLVVQAAALAPPYLTKLLIDRAYPSRDVGLVNVLVGGIFAVSLGKSLLRGLRDYYRLYIVANLKKSIRQFFFNHLQHLPMRFFDQHRVGEVMSRFNDVDSALGMLGETFRTLLLSGVYLLLIPPLLLGLDWRLALIALVGIPLNVLVTTLSGRILRPYWQELAEASAELRAFQVETFSHIRTFKGFALENLLYARNEERLETVVREQTRTGRISHSFGVLSGVTQAVITALYVYLGWRLILQGGLSLGDFIAFTAYVGMLYDPLSNLIGLFSEVQNASVHVERMFEYTDTEAEQSPESARLPRRRAQGFDGSIELHGVAFGYEDGSPVLSDLDLSVPSGTRVAVVGASGSGKTSLLRLMTRLEKPAAGSIHVGGYDLRRLPLPTLRSGVSVVWQEPSILRGSFLENLTVGAPSAGREEVDRVVRLCRLDEVLERMPAGYDTLIGEWGSNLSGGQRQRLMLARAVLRKAPILLLDEVTSNIDVETEQEIFEDLFATLDGTTILYVTHRPASARMADVILQLHGGKLAEVAAHRPQPEVPLRATASGAS